MARSPEELQFTVGPGPGMAPAEHEQSSRAMGSLAEAGSLRATALAEIRLVTALSRALAERRSSELVANREPGRYEELSRRIHQVQTDLCARTRAVQQQMLRSAPLTPAALEMLQSWVELTVDARVMQQDLELQRLVDQAAAEIALRPGGVEVIADPVEPLSAAALGLALGNLSDETVRARERAGQLFCILRPGRKRGREYPAFQAWPGIAGEPLAQVLAALGADSGTAAYGFFTSPNQELANLTPIEVMIGRITHPRALPPEATVLLEAPNTERLESVLEAAQGYAADLAA